MISLLSPLARGPVSKESPVAVWVTRSRFLNRTLSPARMVTTGGLNANPSMVTSVSCPVWTGVVSPGAGGLGGNSSAQDAKNKSARSITAFFIFQWRVLRVYMFLLS